MRRIAVCLSGQPRTWRVTAKSILSFFANPEAEVDYFIHTWSNNTWQDRGSMSFEEEYDKNAIEETFAPKGMMFQQQKRDPTFGFEPLFHSMAVSQSLKKRYELAHNFEYDCVVKCRLDLGFAPKTSFVEKVEPMVVCSADSIFTIGFEFYQRNFSDILFWGDSPTMDVAIDARRWRHAQSQDRQYWTTRIGPGASLYQHMVDHGIHPKEAAGKIDYVIVRKQAQDEKLDIVEDWDRIKKMHSDYYISR